MSLVQSILKSTNESTPYTFYDIGSNTGPYSLLASSSRTNISVHSFDPVKEHLMTLKESVNLNKLENIVTLHEITLSDKEKDETIYLAGSGTTLEKNFLKTPTITRIVHLNTLDSFVSKENLPLPNFIKIDVEGHECKVINGAQKTIGEAKPVLFIEIALGLEI